MNANYPVIQVASRFCGPPTFANGGYICGLVTRLVPQPVTVRLQRPVPLDTPLELREVGTALWAIEYEGQRCLEARATAPLELTIPVAPDFEQAQAYSLNGPHDPLDHPCPGCFVCGPARAIHDGLRIFAGPVPEQDIVAAAWRPDTTLAEEGRVRPELLGAALDCPGYQALRTGQRPWLLGEYTVRVDAPVYANEKCVIIGWKIGGEGRKRIVGTALFNERHQLCAWAQGLWIEPRVAPAS